MKEDTFGLLIAFINFTACPNDKYLSTSHSNYSNKVKDKEVNKMTGEFQFSISTTEISIFLVSTVKYINKYKRTFSVS